jgi:hypothetical protein
MRTQNVLEPWTIYDSIVICNQLYGNEQSVQGWYTSWVQFAAQQEQRFFKSRNEAMCGLAYNNMQSQDRADFAFHAISIGLQFKGPCDGLECATLGEFEQWAINVANFFQFDLPNHVGLTFKLGQDARLDANPYHTPPGYGPRVSGITQGLDEIVTTPVPGTNDSGGQAVVVGTQGEPIKDNRFYFKNVIEIPRNETFEVTIKLSEYARFMLNQMNGPLQYQMYYPGMQGETPAVLALEFPVRYVIQCAIHGLREVQQRGALSA